MSLSALNTSLQGSEKYYGSVFSPNVSALRNIALGVSGTAGNGYTQSQSAISDAGTAFDAGASGMERGYRATGLSPDSDTAASQKRRLGLARVLSQVDAGNRAVDTARENRESAQEWGSEFFVDRTTGGQKVLADVAKREQDRISQYRQAKANKKAGIMSTIGTVAAIAAMFI